MSRTAMALVLALVPLVAAAQSPAEDAQRLFEAGQYPQVAALARADVGPDVIYLAAQAEQRLGAAPQAAALYERLAAGAANDPWQAIGLSARQLLDNALDPALASARDAVARAGMLAETHYQLGLVLARRQEWQPAAAAFDRTAELDPRLAYAYYYGGLMYSRVQQAAQMGVRFEQFLRLAPEAPERPEVVSIMRTMRR
jgi:tetratricopeptide (TPR) repeat protein